MPGVKRVFRRIARILGWTFLLILFLLVAVAFLIRLPSVQNKIVQEAVNYLHKKIGTPVSIGKIYIAFPKQVVITDIFLADQSLDTLLSVKRFSADTDLWGLLHNKVDLNQVSLETLTAKVNRNAHDSTFNFDFIIKAFSSPSSGTDTASQPWAISFSGVQIKSGHLKFSDSVGGNFFQSRIGSLQVAMDEFNLDKSIFKAKEILLDSVEGSFLQLPSTDTKSRQAANNTYALPSLSLGNLRLRAVRFRYEQANQIVVFDTREAEVHPEEIDLTRHVLNIKDVSVKNTLVQVHVLKGPPTLKSKMPDAEGDSIILSPWNVSLSRANFSGIGVQYYDFNAPFQKHSTDLSHFWISGLALVVKDVHLDRMRLAADFEKLSFRERNGLVLRSLRGRVALTERHLSVSDFILATGKSYVTLSASASFSGLQQISQNPEKIALLLKVHPSTIVAGDVLYFQPHLLEGIPLRIDRNEKLVIETSVIGKVNDLYIDNLSLTTLDSTHLELYGSIKGLPDFRRAEATLFLNKVYTSRNDIASVLPDSLKDILTHVPNWIHFKGDFKGSLEQPQLDGILVAEKGSIETHFRIDSLNGNYSGKIKVNEFHVGEVLGDTAVGRVSLTAEVIGSGFSMDKLRAEVAAHVDLLEYRHYAYHDFILKGSFKNYFFSGEAAITDKNLDMNLNADLDYSQDVPQYKLALDLRVADLKALHLSNRELKTRGRLDVNLATADYKRINGNLAIRNFAIFNGVNLYKVDSLLFASIDQDGNSEISVRSDVVSADFKGTINLYALPETLRHHFNNYFSRKDSSYARPAADQNFKFELVLKDTELLTEILLPELDPFVPGVMKGEYNSAAKKLELRFGISKLKYGSFSVDSVKFDVISDAQKMNYALALKDLRADTLRVPGLKFSGIASHDSLRARLAITDSLKKEKYLLGGVVTSLMGDYRFRILPKELLLNYEPWSTPDDNFLRFGGQHMATHHFEISKDRERVALEKAGATDSVTTLVFNNLNLESITSLVEGLTPVGGIADGDFTVSAARHEVFTSRLKVHGFSILNQTWGDLDISLRQQKGSPYNLEFGIKGDKTEIKISGTYSPDPKSASLALRAQLTKVDLSALQPLMFGKIKRMEGLLVGDLKIDGSMANPDVNGTLSFKNAVIVPTAFNSAFSLRNETLNVKSTSLVFRNFKITDEKNEVATINGTMDRKKNWSFGLHLDVNAKDFQILNSTMKDNSLFYGKVSITSRLLIRGSLQQPHITTDLSISDKSNFTFVVPQSEKGIQEQKGIVQWVDRDAVLDPFLASVQPTDTIRTILSGVEISANIELKETETFNVVIDPATGDKLSVRGNAALTFHMSPAGDMRLSGRYDITAGTYDFSFYKLVKRNFVINKGSYITWTGDPFEAIMDITAVYKVETAPLELILNQVTTNNQQELNTYKQRLPFLVDLNIKGQLLSPDISFKLDMPQDKQNAFGGNIYAVIQDLNTREADLNKQVFSLLVLQRFMTDNPFESQSGEGLSGTARSSVSAILTQQLNRLSQNVKGIQLSFDVKSYQDYSSGNAQGNTQLQLGVSKSLLNDRLIVKVAGNVSVEGSAAPQNSAADYIGDLALEYKLTQDGRLRISGFRNSNYDMIDGELIETGAGLIYIKDYNAFSELFKANEKTP